MHSQSFLSPSLLILFVCHHEQVLRIAATSVLTLVVYLLFGWDGSEKQLVYRSVCRNRPAINIDTSVTTPTSASAVTPLPNVAGGFERSGYDFAPPKKS